jgi:uncharacterized membrane protein YesL
MGIFGGNFNKVGPGVSKEDARKRNYFDMLGRKFWKLCQLNMLYFLCILPFLAVALFFALPLLVSLFQESAAQEFVAELEDYLQRGGKMYVFFSQFWPIFAPFALIGPFTAGLTYVARNYSRQEHAFLCSDFFEHTRKNIKQGLAASALGTLFLFVGIVAFLFYLEIFPNLQPLILALGAVFAALFLSMGFYVFPMMVTFDMKFWHIIKNAWIFAAARLFQNLFFLIITGGVHVLLLLNFPVVWALLMPLVLVAWTAFTINYYTTNVIGKFMLPKDESAAEKETVFEDSIEKNS